jgi:hypothetical protein
VTTDRGKIGKIGEMLLVFATVSVAAACDGESTGCAEPVPLAITDDVRVPPDLDLTTFGTLTRLDVDRGFTTYRVETTSSVQDLYVPITRQVRRDGWDLVGSENEGVDAEVYLARREGDTGVIRLNDLECAGTVAIEVAVDRPVESASNSSTPAETPSAEVGSTQPAPSGDPTSG